MELYTKQRFCRVIRLSEYKFCTLYKGVQWQVNMSASFISRVICGWLAMTDSNKLSHHTALGTAQQQKGIEPQRNTAPV